MSFDSASLAKSILQVVATPIGNRDDLSPRARRALEEADVIAAEDTRVARKLLSSLGIEGKRLVSYYDEVEEKRAAQLIAEMQASVLRVVLISDAGTPCVSDPGYRLVALAHAAGVTVSPIPGPSAMTALISSAGLANNRILFIGFLPAKQGELLVELQTWKTHRGSVCFFESLRRLQQSVQQIGAMFPGVSLAIGRELTKIYEEIWRGSVEEAQEWLSAHGNLKGEAVIMVDLSQLASGPTMAPEELTRLAASDFRRGATLKDLLQKYRDEGFGRKELYQLLLTAKGETDG